MRNFVKSRRVIVIADACHASGVGSAFDPAITRGAERPSSAGTAASYQVAPGVCVISAAADGERSREHTTWGGGHGVFTFALIEGLHGAADYNGDQTVTVGELIPYVSDRVRRETRNGQSPTVAGKFNPAITIGRPLAAPAAQP